MSPSLIDRDGAARSVARLALRTVHVVVAGWLDDHLDGLSGGEVLERTVHLVEHVPTGMGRV